jgi:hypothetical protein
MTFILIDDDTREVVDRDLDVAEFVRVNMLDADEAATLLALPLGGKRTYGGGAAPQFTVIAYSREG